MSCLGSESVQGQGEAASPGAGDDRVGGPDEVGVGPEDQEDVLDRDVGSEGTRALCLL